MSVAAAGRASERAHRQRPLARIVVVWLLATATIVGLGALLSGVNVKSVGAALAAAAVIGLVNALVWPIVLWFALPLTVMTLDALRAHPGIGFLLVRSEEHGAVAMGLGGINFLDEDRVEGEDPLAPFGEFAPTHVKRTDGFSHCPDIVVNSTYWHDRDEVAAFEELVGSHGGLGGTQAYPFLLHPLELELPREEIIGAALVHRHLRRWLVELGQEAYRTDDMQETARELAPGPA